MPSAFTTTLSRQRELLKLIPTRLPGKTVAQLQQARRFKKEWLQANLPGRPAIASSVAPILIEGGWATKVDNQMILFI